MYELRELWKLPSRVANKVNSFLYGNCSGFGFKQQIEFAREYLNLFNPGQFVVVIVENRRETINVVLKVKTVQNEI